MNQTSSRSIGDLSQTLEDYLEIIFHLQQQRKVARVKEIAQQKGVKMASVSVALKRLAREGMVRYEAHGFVELTESGLALARKVVSRHEFLCRFLREVLLIDAEVAEADACALEHQISTQTLERMVCFFQHLMDSAGAEPRWIAGFRDACAAPRPGEVQQKASRPAQPPERTVEPQPLSLLKQGEVGRVVRMLAGSAVRQRLVEMGVLPNVAIEMDGSSPLGDPIRVKIRGYRLSLRRSEADTILVLREQPA
ncbi:MAG: hypothetical protein FJ125_01175 [Deltaproteobacteria bacterium]|nr:hypothetical protein [Deltaproteobacteria bacterium]